MAFGTTAAIVINSITKTLNRIRDDGYSSEYLLRTATEEFRMNVRHSNSIKKTSNPLLRGVDRHNIEVVHRIFATATTSEIVRKTYTVIENAPGDVIADVSLFAQGVLSYAGNATRVDDQLAWLS